MTPKEHDRTYTRIRRGSRAFADKMKSSVCIGCRYEHTQCYVIHAAPTYDRRAHSWSCFWNLPKKLTTTTITI